MAADAVRAEGLHDCRDAWATTIEALAAEDERIVVVVNDSIGSSKLGGFQKKFPGRTINVGIAEQCMVGVGAGLANGGRIPFVSAAACFLTGRALEQIKADIAYAGFNVSWSASLRGWPMANWARRTIPSRISPGCAP